MPIHHDGRVEAEDTLESQRSENDLSHTTMDQHQSCQRVPDLPRTIRENTNGCLRQYFPKGTDLSVHSPKRLLEVATELNGRPRKVLGGVTPAQAMERLLSEPGKPPGATTA